MPDRVGVVNGTLHPCPSTPNCIRTGEGTSPAEAEVGARERSVPNLKLRSNDEASWSDLVQAVAEMPRTKVITQAGGYVHAEARSLVFRFVDDLELLWLVESGEIQVRSASRLGSGDLGVNRRRVE
ncbi:MAG: DUF1499 domain-containing protein, partial [Gemmatimonadota bacterium]|nr:DUF1499 domain-containing protein [Gemmatimonadota bacterium]